MKKGTKEFIAIIIPKMPDLPSEYSRKQNQEDFYLRSPINQTELIKEKWENLK